MDAYYRTMDSLGESILTFMDPHGRYTGYTKGWPLTDFTTAISIGLGYVFVVIVGTAIMKAGVPAIEAYPLKFAYNVSQIFLCAYMTIEALMIAHRNNYSIWCNDYQQHQPVIANLLWLNYLSKLWDFWDTIFIILGKKWRQLSFLHVYHHFVTFMFFWLDINACYDGDIFLTMALNGFIHTVMYTYYFICMHTKVPETGKNLKIWWKSSLTIMQMIQFVTMMSQAIYVISFHRDRCTGHAVRLTTTYLIYVLTLFYLFAQFFVRNYMMSTKTGKKQKKKQS